MNGAQDLGGMMGFGPIAPEQDEPLFHAPWEKRALAVTLAMGATGSWNLDTSRHARETLPPAEYLSASYYEIWIKGLTKLLVNHDLVSLHELSGNAPIAPGRPVKRVMKAADVPAALAKGNRCDRPATAPAAWSVGDVVRVRNNHPVGHTRAPRYTRGRRGVIESVNGVFVLPDSNAHGGGENPEWLYTVVFDGRELWGDAAEVGHSVMADLWESYLERA